MSTVPADERSDRELLAAHVAGDPDAFTELVRRHRDRLWAVALRTSGDREEAADALQEALLAAFRRADTFRGDAAVTTWLHRIVVNACLDRFRRRAARPADPTGDLELADPRVAGDHADAADRRIDVQRALATLPMGQRSALVLVDLQGLPVAEVAQILGVAEGTVKSRCARGRAALAPLLGRSAEADPPSRVDPPSLTDPPSRTGEGNQPAPSGVPPSRGSPTSSAEPADVQQGGAPIEPT